MWPFVIENRSNGLIHVRDGCSMWRADAYHPRSNDWSMTLFWWLILQVNLRIFLSFESELVRSFKCLTCCHNGTSHSDLIRFMSSTAAKWSKDPPKFIGFVTNLKMDKACPTANPIPLVPFTLNIVIFPVNAMIVDFVSASDSRLKSPDI